MATKNSVESAVCAGDKNSLIDHEFLQNIFEHSLDAYFLLDLDANLVMGNLDRDNILSKKGSDFVGKNIMQINLIKDKYLPRALTMMAKAKTGLVVGPENLIINGVQGERLIEVIVRSIDICGTQYIFGVARDLTDIKKREQDLNDKIEELEKVNNIMVDRELKMVELKNKLEALKQKYEATS
jgi:PAS domain S-box-containing protein